MAPALLSLLDRLAAASAETVAAYPAPSGRRFRDDATRLAAIADDTYDVVLCGWLLVHLDAADERRVFEAVARVLRPGGEARLRAGTGEDLAARVRDLFPTGIAAGKRLSVDPASEADLVILRVSRA
jgi:SAM-dependent methyltransferase